jgi:rare lipoprotein A
MLAFAASASANGTGYSATGYASWYGHELSGRKTAIGERFNPNGISAAHRTLPLPSYIEVTALDTGKTILVRVNDRGPYHGNRLIDLSLGAARQLGLSGQGARLVHLRQVDPSEQERDVLRKGSSLPVRFIKSHAELVLLRKGSAWKAPAAPRTALDAGIGPYFIQIATFSALPRAITMARALGGSVDSRGNVHHVRLGPFKDAKHVNAALAPLAAKGYPDVRIVR